MATYFNSDDPKRSRAWRASIDQMTWTNGEGVAEKTETICAIGLVKMICIRISAASGNPTVTITIKDSLTNEIYNTGALADGTNYVYTYTEFLPTANDFPVCGQITVGVTPSLDSGANPLTVDMDIYGI